MRRNELPDTCFSVLPSTGQLIIIKKSESGYYPSEWDAGNREENRDIASSHNARQNRRILPQSQYNPPHLLYFQTAAPLNRLLQIMQPLPIKLPFSLS